MANTLALSATFLLSLVLPFLCLRHITVVARRALNEAGLDFSDLILIGLPKDKDNPDMGNLTAQEFIDALKTLDFATLASSPIVLATSGAVLLALLWSILGGSPKTRKVLDPKIWQEFPLSEKIQISPNTAIYRFALPRKTDVLGLPIGQHISVSAEINGKEIMRSYTPTSSDDDLGHFDLLIKTYEKGNISRHVSLLKVGDTIRVKGPKGQFTYSPTLTSHIGMIAGGTGITPMIQIIRAALKNPNDKTKLTLIYANVNPDDILLKEDLEKLLDTSNKRLNVFYVLNNPPKAWSGGVGFVTKEHIAEYLPKADTDCKVLMCGPPPMIGAMKKHLDELKFPPARTVSKLVDQVFVF